MTQYIDLIMVKYGWLGVALAALIIIFFTQQLCYYIGFLGRIAKFKNSRRGALLDQEPPVSIVIPMFNEDYNYIEERLPLMLAQNYKEFEIVLVYVGASGEFFEDLQALQHSFPRFKATKIVFDPRFPISRKMALNVGIKSAQYEHMIFSSTDAIVQSDRWLALMAKGFTRGEIVLGYCGMESTPSALSSFSRTWRMMHSASWLGQAIKGRTARAILHNMGFTKSVYFGAKGFNRLNMNIGEDDLFIAEVATRENVSVILSPKATLQEKIWSGFGWWFDRLRLYHSSYKYYNWRLKSRVTIELWSRVLLLFAVIASVVLMPLEFWIGALALLVIRHVFVLVGVRKLSKRLGEKGIVGGYMLYDFVQPILEIALRVISLKRDERVWR